MNNIPDKLRVREARYDSAVELVDVDDNAIGHVYSNASPDYDATKISKTIAHRYNSFMPLLVAAKKAATVLKMLGCAPSLELRNAIRDATFMSSGD